MSSPGSINPQVIAARNTALLQMLAAGLGATLTAKVVGPAPNGLTTVTVGKETLNLSITPPPAPGSTLQLKIEGSGPAVKLTLVSQTPPKIATQPLPLPPAASTVAPTAQPVVSGAALAPQTAISVPLPQSVASAPVPLPQTSTAAPLPHAATSVARPSMPAVSVPASTPAEILAARPGLVLTATVVGAAPNGQTEVVLAGKTSLTLPITPPPAAGSIVQLSVEGTGSAAKLVLANQALPIRPAGGEPGISGQATAAPTQSQAGAVAARAVISPMPPGAALAGGPNAAVAAGQSQQAPPASPPAAQATPAQTALNQMIPAAATRQDSMAPLLANLTGLASRLRQMPADVARPATQLLSSIVNADKPVTAQIIQQAVARSGVFLEAKLGAATAPQGDVKSALLQLRSALTQWLGTDSIAAPVHPHRPAPPTRGAVPRAQRTALPEAPSTAPLREAARPLLDQADAAIHRVRLMQLSSLPDDARPMHAERNLEIPLVLGNELSIAQFQIFRDGRAESEAAQRGWQMRFSVNFSEIGEVGAHVTLRGKRTSVTLWADREDTAEALDEMLPELASSLAARGLEPGAVGVRRGIPNEPEHAPGGLVDSIS